MAILEKDEIIDLASRHDKKHFLNIQKEKEIGDRLRKTKVLTKDDLIKIMDWKFDFDPRIKSTQIKHAKAVNKKNLETVSNEVFNLDPKRDLTRISRLCEFKGIKTSVASVILTFYDPKNYCVGDWHIYHELFGFKPKTLTIEQYIRVLDRIRVEAKKCGLDAREVEKAYFFKNCNKIS